MTKKAQLYYLLYAFRQGKYQVSTFCKSFEELFYPDIPKDELAEYEFVQFKFLAEIVVRFSPYQEDLNAYPGVYRTEKEVVDAIEKVWSNLANKGTR